MCCNTTGESIVITRGVGLWVTDWVEEYITGVNFWQIFILFCKHTVKGSMFSETQFLVRIKIIKPLTQDIIICIRKIERCSLCYTCYLMLYRYLSAIDMSEW